MRATARNTRLLAQGLVIALLMAAGSDAGADQATAQKYAESAWTLLNAGQWAQALVEYKLAYQAAPKDEYLFNMANCEYQLGQLKDALDHYQAYLHAAAQTRDGKRPRNRTEAVETARMRIEAINHRESVITIHAVPEGADVRIEGPKALSGRATRTSEFRVTSGHYRVTVSKPTYVSQTSELDLGFGDAKALFFDLHPIPGRLRVRTTPPGATLYVRGNRAQNPYDQQVEPGQYEIYAEATDYKPGRKTVEVQAGKTVPVDFPLEYVQRSGRPELIWFWTAAGAVAIGGVVLARIEPRETPAAGSLAVAGGIVGGIGGAVISTATPLVPPYIRDNVALFRIGNMWIGAVEGASLGILLAGPPSLTGALFGGGVGLAAGAIAGIPLDSKAPKYGRVAMIQSSAAIGLLAGALAVPALNESADFVDRYSALGVLAGVNVGLGAGLALTYLPDQDAYGPSWQRVVLMDLGIAAGAFAGAVATTVDKCLPKGSSEKDCRFGSDQRTARATLLGGAVGLALSWLVTRNFDKKNNSPSEWHDLSLLPVPSALAVPTVEGGLRLVPGLAAQGRF